MLSEFSKNNNIVKLIYLGKELDVTVEKEIFSGSKFGFNAIVTYKKDSWMSKAEKKELVETYHNLTEIHHLFSSHFEDKQIAFESDIHSTGCTRKISEIEIVDIHIATKKEKNY